MPKSRSGSASEFDAAELDSVSASGNERRRSERVKRDKPDYYDALDFDHKKRKSTATPKSASGRATLTWKKRPQDAFNDVDDDEDESASRKRHRKRRRSDFDEFEEENATAASSSKASSSTAKDASTSSISVSASAVTSLQCRASLAEINRKLCVVMLQPR